MFLASFNRGVWIDNRPNFALYGCVPVQEMADANAVEGTVHQIIVAVPHLAKSALDAFNWLALVTNVPPLAVWLEPDFKRESYNHVHFGDGRPLLEQV